MGATEMSGEDRRHAEFLTDADLVVHDAQYLAHECYQRIGWGHSTVEYALAVSRLAGVRQLALTHHDPKRDDDAIDDVIGSLPHSVTYVFAAAEGQEVELSSIASVNFRSEAVVPDPGIGYAGHARSVRLTGRGGSVGHVHPFQPPTRRRCACDSMRHRRHSEHD